MQILIECARARRDATALRRAAAGVEDWTALLEKADRHGMAPLLYWSLNQICPEMAPPAVLTRLRAQFYRNALRNQWLSKELVRLVALFEAAGLDVLPFKGPALASFYEDPGLREMSDLDLLVRCPDVESAIKLLVDAGYKLSYTADRRFYRGYEELQLASPATGIVVDLHWALAPAHFVHALAVEDFYSRLVKVTVDDGQLQTLAHRDLLVFLCLHGAKHWWCSLKWLADLARLVESGELDWDGIVADARARRGSRMLFAGLLLAADVLGAAVPDRIIAAARADSVASKLAAGVQGRLLADAVSNLAGREYYSFQWLLMERISDKLQFCWGHLPPKVADLVSVRLPPAFYPAYFAVRPLRLMAKYGGRFARSFLRPAKSECAPERRAASASKTP